jgi:hypothetical protein
MTAGFRIDGREYEMSSIRRVTLRDTLTFNAEARRADLGITWAGLLALVDEVTALTVAERVNHEGTWLLMAAVIWSSRRSQGEDVSFLDAIDVPLEDIEWFGDPQDEAPQDAPGGGSNASGWDRPGEGRRGCSTLPWCLPFLLPCGSSEVTLGAVPPAGCNRRGGFVYHVGQMPLRTQEAGRHRPGASATRLRPTRYQPTQALRAGASASAPQHG